VDSAKRHRGLAKDFWRAGRGVLSLLEVRARRGSTGGTRVEGCGGQILRRCAGHGSCRWRGSFVLLEVLDEQRNECDGLGLEAKD